jgi:alkylation response protein AidB-like acyl-CoA dehydrogenase
MDFKLSKPQKMLQDSAKEFLTRHCSFERVRELMETKTAHDAELWEGLTDQGWVALTLPEEHEGLELGAVDLVAVTEAMGSFTMPGPFLSNTWRRRDEGHRRPARRERELGPATMRRGDNARRRFIHPQWREAFRARRRGR